MDGRIVQPQKCDIYVAVYRNISLATAKSLYPVSKAMKWRNKNIAELNEDSPNNRSNINIAFCFL